MMKNLYLKHLTIYQFKNYAEATLDFSKQVICFTGENGSGKTNLLDAIYYLSNCKSFFNPVDSQNIMLTAEQCSITGEFERDEHPEQIICTIRKNQRKVFKRNFKEYERLSEHIGLIPVVIITPYDIELIWEGSEVRRKFLDATISSLSKKYLENLVAYHHALNQRNNLLKQFGKQGNYAAEVLEPWDFQLAHLAAEIFQERKTFIHEFTAEFSMVYHLISGEKENAGIEYHSDLQEETMENLLAKNSDRDRFLERTSAGIHRDDLEFTLNGQPLKKFGSQGQQKSFLFALKLAQYLFLRNHMSINPILMLDDLFDKIDEKRMSQILDWLSRNHVGQIFITDTHTTRIPEILTKRNLAHEVWEVSSGSVHQIK
ncbi:MAG: DNA replication/repair protein RecF [Flavobacteriales bacterium]|nr:DNA replication/repair protein RecF [Flavobacteriales bacterium]